VVSFRVAATFGGLFHCNVYYFQPREVRRRISCGGCWYVKGSGVLVHGSVKTTFASLTVVIGLFLLIDVQISFILVNTQKLEMGLCLLRLRRRCLFLLDLRCGGVQDASRI